jgi:hypothetical protein
MRRRRRLLLTYSTRYQSGIGRDTKPVMTGLDPAISIGCLLTEIASFTLSVRTASLVALPTKKVF